MANLTASARPVCIKQEQHQWYQTAPPTSANDSSMWASDQFSQRDHNGPHSHFRASFNPSFRNSSNYYDPYTRTLGTFATPPRHFLQFTQRGFSDTAVGAQDVPSYRPLKQDFECLSETACPFTTAEQMTYYPTVQSFRYDSRCSVFPHDRTLPISVSPTLSFASTPDQYYPQSRWPQSPPIPAAWECKGQAVQGSDEPNGASYEKPYAQLIYDALLQAPGHRMLLRDIYEWFVRNTKKPRESGTNGWQNSIRHNLSMNQAFENDKNDPASSRGARKANSVWVLTDNAVRHGVQSTTRYRKSNSTKKATNGKTPAIQRQRSGAKGGRAARRAAQMKRSQPASSKVHVDPPKLESSPYSSHNIELLCYSAPGPWSAYDSYSPTNYSPTTPRPDQFLDSSHTLQDRVEFTSIGSEDTKYAAESFFEDEGQLRQLLSQQALEDDLGHLAMF